MSGTAAGDANDGDDAVDADVDADYASDVDDTCTAGED